MAAATSMAMHIMAVLFLLSFIAAAQDASDNLHIAQTTFASDDQCATGDNACALNALQRRGNPKEERKDDITAGGEDRLNEDIQDIIDTIKTNLTASLTHLQNMTDELHTVLMEKLPAYTKPGTHAPPPPKDEPIPEDEIEAPGEDEIVDDELGPFATGGRRRRSKPYKYTVPPRRKRVQKKLEGLQKVFDKLWIKTKRTDRLNYWIRAKIGDPKYTPDFVERVDGTATGMAKYGPPNKYEKDMEKVIEGLYNQVDDFHIEVERQQAITDELYAAWCKKYRQCKK